MKIKLRDFCSGSTVAELFLPVCMNKAAIVSHSLHLKLSVFKCFFNIAMLKYDVDFCDNYCNVWVLWTRQALDVFESLKCI